MNIKPIKKKMKLYGFNNLTKTLSFNFYDICYALTPEHRHEYIEYVDEEYNAERLTAILEDVASIIGATVLNVARQDYDPQGASVTILIAENGFVTSEGEAAKACGLHPEAVVAHLDKSHLTVHTYPESHPDKGISTFRADIDISTCGQISPLLALNHLLDNFKPDIAVMDYRVRGFTRDIEGKKLYRDHKINSIQNFIAKKTRNQYQMIDVNIYQENIFHTKMILKEYELDNYLFGTAKESLSSDERKRIKQRISREMQEIFLGRNLPRLKSKHRRLEAPPQRMVPENPDRA